MNSRDPRAEEAELEFSERELTDMNAEVVGREVSDGRRRRRALRVPADEVPRAQVQPSQSAPEEPVSTHRIDPVAVLVEHAFSNGGRAEGVVPAAAEMLVDDEALEASDLMEEDDELLNPEAVEDVDLDEEPVHATTPSLAGAPPLPEARPVAESPRVSQPEIEAPPVSQPKIEATAVNQPEIEATPVSQLEIEATPVDSPEIESAPASQRETESAQVAGQSQPLAQIAAPALPVEAAIEAQPVVEAEDQPPPPKVNPALAALARAVATPAGSASWLGSPTVVSEEPPPVKSDESMELAGEELVEIKDQPMAAQAAAPPPMPAAAPALPVAEVSRPAAPALRPGEPLRPRRKRRVKQWFEEIFDDDYLRTLPHLTPRQTEREAGFIAESLEVAQNGSVLDVGCGHGRHSMELAKKGYRLTGLDLSLPLLIRAADSARRVGLNINFIHGDMREMTFENEFDAAFSMFTSFGYFDDDTNRKVMANISRALKPGGKILIDLINRDYLVHDLPTRVWWQGEGCVVLEEVDFNYFSSRLQVQRSIIFEDGRQAEQEISIRAYSLHEIGKVLHHSGFRVTEVSGGLSLRGRFFGAGSRQLMVLAEKKQSG